MAGLGLNEEQKLQLRKLRRKLEMTPYAFLAEEKRRFFNSLDLLEQEGEENVSPAQDSVALQVLLSDLKQLVLRLGKEHGLYRDALDALRALAPEMVGEVERQAEQMEQRRQLEMAQMLDDRQERIGHRFDWLEERLNRIMEDTEEDEAYLEQDFDEIQTEDDRNELSAYIRRKSEGILTQEEVERSREHFRDRAEERIREELKKDKPDKRLCRRLTIRRDSMIMGWNPDDMQMMDIFTGIVAGVPAGKVKEDGQLIMAKLMQTRVTGWEQRQILIDCMTEYCEAAALAIYPDGNVAPAFRKAVAKMLDLSTHTVSQNEYPEDPQFTGRDQRSSQEKQEKAAVKAAAYVFGTPEADTPVKKGDETEVKQAEGGTRITLGSNAGNTYVCSLTSEKERITEEAARTGRLIIVSGEIPENCMGYTDAANGQYYPAEDMGKLPAGVFFAAKGNLYRITSIAQLDDLTEQVQFALDGETDTADRIRKYAKIWFMNNRIRDVYENAEEREGVVLRNSQAQQSILASVSDKYGMRELKQAVSEYQLALQKDDSRTEIEQREAEMMKRCREYMAKVPEKIGNTTRNSLEQVTDLLCGLQREYNFRQKNKQYDTTEKKNEKKKEYAWELGDLLKLQEVAGEQGERLRRFQMPLASLGKEKHMRKTEKDAYVRLEKALFACVSIDSSNSIREIGHAAMELRLAALAFGRVMDWNGMEALGKASNEKEREQIGLIQKLQRYGKVFADEVLELTEKISDKNTMLGRLVEKKLWEDDLRREKERAKEKVKENIPDMKEPVLNGPFRK